MTWWDVKQGVDAYSIACGSSTFVLCGVAILLLAVAVLVHVIQRGDDR